MTTYPLSPKGEKKTISRIRACAELDSVSEMTTKEKVLSHVAPLNDNTIKGKDMDSCLRRNDTLRCRYWIIGNCFASLAITSFDGA